MSPGIITVDLHGKTTYQARITVDALLRRGHTYSQIQRALRTLEMENDDDFREE